MKIENSIPDEDIWLRALSVNLNESGRLHKVLYRLIQNEIAVINRRLELEESGDLFLLLKQEKDTLVNSYDFTLNNTFLLQWSFIEEMFYAVHKFKYKNLTIKSGSSITRYKPIFNHLDIELKDYIPWDFLTSAEKVRNCLLHTNGRIDINKNSSWLKTEVSNNPNFYKLNNSRIIVEGEFINTLHKHAHTILNDLMNNALALT